MIGGAVNDDGEIIVLRRGTGLKPGVCDAPLTRLRGLTPVPRRRNGIGAVNGLVVFTVGEYGSGDAGCRDDEAKCVLFFCLTHGVQSSFLFASRKLLDFAAIGEGTKVLLSGMAAVTRTTLGRFQSGLRCSCCRDVTYEAAEIRAVRHDVDVVGIDKK